MPYDCYFLLIPSAVGPYWLQNHGWRNCRWPYWHIWHYRCQERHLGHQPRALYHQQSNRYDSGRRHIAPSVGHSLQASCLSRGYPHRSLYPSAIALRCSLRGYCVSLRAYAGCSLQKQFSYFLIYSKTRTKINNNYEL